MPAEPTPEQIAAAAAWFRRWRLDDSRGYVEALAELLAERESVLQGGLEATLARIRPLLADLRAVRPRFVPLPLGCLGAALARLHRVSDARGGISCAAAEGVATTGDSAAQQGLRPDARAVFVVRETVSGAARPCLDSGAVRAEFPEGDDACPSCCANKRAGHHAGCNLAALLGREERKL